jgi:hypothetical protein
LKNAKAEKADRKPALVDVPPADDVVQGEQPNQPE